MGEELCVVFVKRVEVIIIKYIFFLLAALEFIEHFPVYAFSMSNLAVEVTHYTGIVFSSYVSSSSSCISFFVGSIQLWSAHLMVFGHRVWLGLQSPRPPFDLTDPCLEFTPDTNANTP